MLTWCLQLAELKLGVAERNQLVYKLHHQLVTQEVQNRLLQTDLQRTHMQVDFLQDAKSKGTLRRVKTFAGADFMTRGVSYECATPKSEKNDNCIEI